MVTLTAHDYDEWRAQALVLLTEGTPPDGVAWLPADGALPFADTSVQPAVATRPAPAVPRAFVTLAKDVALHRDDTKWPVLYRLVWRLTHGERHILENEADEDTRTARQMAAQVSRDAHKMRAFVRFTPVADPVGTRYVGWYAPDHLIVEREAPFFVDRFHSMRWSILTPDLSAHWDGQALQFTPGVTAAPLTDQDDAIADLWRAYYESTFNAARVNPQAMQREMPWRRWRQLPEATVIPRLINQAQERATGLRQARREVDARAYLPAERDLPALAHAAASCRGCRLHAAATQTVFGASPGDARLVLVGEQPGDAEDIAGRPFVGPAGQVLDRALAEAGIDRGQAYLTNAVKHFSFEPRGKRRIHQTPRLSEMQACRPWLEAELHAIRPAVVVALGATAARALVGPQARVMALRGRILEGLAWAPRVIVTVHPSAVLRSEDDGERYFQMLVSDLTLAAS